MFKLFYFDILITTTVAAGPLLHLLKLVCVYLGSPGEYLIVDVEHHMHFLIYFDLHSLCAQLAVLLRKLQALWPRKVLKIFEFLVSYKRQA